MICIRVIPPSARRRRTGPLGAGEEFKQGYGSLLRRALLPENAQGLAEDRELRLRSRPPAVARVASGTGLSGVIPVEQRGDFEKHVPGFEEIRVNDLLGRQHRETCAGDAAGWDELAVSGT